MPRDIRLGNAVLGFRADVRQYISGLSAAERAARAQQQAIRRLRNQMRQLRRSLDNTVRSVLSFRGAFATLAGTSGIGLLVSRASQAGATLFELSTRTGVAAEELQTLGRVFEGDGIAADQFAKFIQRVNSALGGAQQGLSTYTRAFEALGISVENVTGVRDAIDQIADAVASGNISRQSVFFALQQLGGRQGFQAINILQQGAAAIREQEAAFARLGVVTLEQSAALKTLAQTQTDLGNAISTNFNALVADFAGPLNRVLNNLTAQIPGLFDSIREGIETLIRNARIVTDAFIVLGVVLLRRTFLGRFAANALIAATSITALARGVLLAARTIVRLVWPLALIEGVITTLRFVRNLREESELLGITLGQSLLEVGAQAAGFFAQYAVLTAEQLLLPFRAFGRTIGPDLERVTTSVLEVGGAIAGLVGPLVDRVLNVANRSFIFLENIIAGARQRLGAAFSGILSFFGNLADILFAALPEPIQAFLTSIGGALRRYRQNAVSENQTAFAAIAEILGVSRTAIITFLRGVVEGFTAMATLSVQVVRETGSLIVDILAEAGVRAFNSLVRAITGQGEAPVEDLGRFVRERFTESLRGLEADLGEFGTVVGNVRPLEDALRRIREDVQEPLRVEIEAEAPQTRGFFRRLFDNFNEEFAASQERAERAGAITAQTARNVIGISDQQEAAQTALARAARRTADEFRGISEAAEGIVPAVDISDTLAAAQNQLMDFYQDMSDGARRAANEVEDRFERVAMSIGDAFGRFASSAILDFSSIGDAARSLANTILNTLAQALIATPISNAFSGLLGGLFGGIGAAQTGGQHSGLTLVGEAGPELVDFRRPAQVYTSDQLRQAISGQAAGAPGAGLVNVNLTVNSADAGAVDRAIADSLPGIVDAIRGALTADMRRPSMVGAAVRGF